MNERLVGNLLALLISLAGWFYLTRSHTAESLSGIEGEGRNRRRVRLRRFGGFLMLACAAFLYAGNNLLNPRWALACWGAVLILLLGIVVLALLDLRFTMKLRKRN